MIGTESVPTERKPQVLAPAEVAALIRGEPRVRLLDVRTAGEYASVHIAGAYNVPLDTLGEHWREIAAVQDPLVLVCQSGQRARKAEEALRSAGLENLRVLDGGACAPAFGWLAAFVGGGLTFAGITDTCGMAMLLARLPYNRAAACDVGAAVRALSEGRAAATGSSRLRASRA